MSSPRFIISGGGTGGHIFPAIAIADELKSRFPEADILFVGAKDRMEMQKVPAAGYPIKGLWISGIQRKLTLDNLSFPLKLIKSIAKSRQIIKQFKPDVVIGTGGFASGPLLRAANQKKVPTVIQEQNSYAGVTNKWVAAKANAICVAYDGMEKYFPKHKLRFTGNPVRQDLLEINSKREKAISYFELDQNKKTLLVLGGSLGARTINELIEKHLDFFEEQDIQVVWQTGKLYFDRFQQYNDKKHVKVHQFLDKMDYAYACADLIISRSGAGTVSELCVVGKPVIFIPSPNVAEDHQTKNAKAIAEKEAAILLKESELENFFKSLFLALMNDEKKQKKMAKNIQDLAKPNATRDIVNEIIKLL
ncbi:undecaprenyldiphospho-muramoylpentapeptide beta-N-acetylglucosaminyltransferase [Mesonia sp. K7]|uniref:undecaprenyldiphospho-muramoylpentapeptide beta-N-acetylglucosaminyltransferase n=1 Tax=Mesonia sp. K7 TaxID=2218606 RepID=UPI000DA86ADD|nr:undecaprenyldiphospho-muramoylpentapeptide beta-N-acetylglucosaminyltransferase [Mesonia sp. K7]PZD78016.1 undecaprenyldiphospho-muramoylpentapeptide beta-N-acetylglucosaminyltransferase [Mesonia sp. K7]